MFESPKTIRVGIQLAKVRRRCADGGLLESRRSFDIASAWMDWGGRDPKRAGLDIQGSRTCLNSVRLLIISTPARDMASNVVKNCTCESG
jgi:hypothetical protein